MSHSSLDALVAALRRLPGVGVIVLGANVLRNALLESPANEDDRIAQERMKGMHDLIELMTTWFDDVQRLAPETAMQLMGMGTAVTRVLEFKDRLTGKGSHSPKSNPSGV